MSGPTQELWLCREDVLGDLVFRKHPQRSPKIGPMAALFPGFQGVRWSCPSLPAGGLT